MYFKDIYLLLNYCLKKLKKFYDSYFCLLCGRVVFMAIKLHNCGQIILLVI